KDTGGYGEHAEDEEIIEGMQLLARTEGIFTETAGGVTVAATRKLIESGRIPRNEPIVICVTGNGLKTPDVLYDRLSVDVTIRPSLAVFDKALADLKSKPGARAGNSRRRDMAVLVRIPTPLRSLTRGQAEVQAAADSVGGLIEDLEKQYPGLKDRLVDEGGEVRRFINFYVNEEDIRFLQGAKTALKTG